MSACTGMLFGLALQIQTSYASSLRAGHRTSIALAPGLAAKVPSYSRTTAKKLVVGFARQKLHLIWQPSLMAKTHKAKNCRKSRPRMIYTCAAIVCLH